MALVSALQKLTPKLNDLLWGHLVDIQELFFWPFYELGKLYRNAVDQIKLQGRENSFFSLNISLILPNNLGPPSQWL